MPDDVKWPSHYNQLTTQPIDVINALDLGFNLGNALKYIWRAGHKENAVQDLQKAAFYLAFELYQRSEGPDPRQDALTAELKRLGFKETKLADGGKRFEKGDSFVVLRGDCND